MFLGAGEIVVVLAVALMVLGPKKMPEVARNLARFVAQLRRMADDVRSQVDDALQETPQKTTPREQPTLPPPGVVYDAATTPEAASMPSDHAADHNADGGSGPSGVHTPKES